MSAPSIIDTSTELPADLVWQLAGHQPAGVDMPVLTPADGSPAWRDRCSICLLTRAECGDRWELHEMQRRTAYAAQRGLPYRLDVCGECGGGLGDQVVQKDGVRYCCRQHAEPYKVPVKACCEVFVGEMCSCADDVLAGWWLASRVIAPSAAYRATADTIEVAA